MRMQVLAYRRSDEPIPQGVHKIYCQQNGDKLSNMLAESDYVVLAVPLTNLTHEMIGAEEFAQMKQSAHFVNIARGKVVNEADLVITLQIGQIAGAGYD